MVGSTGPELTDRVDSTFISQGVYIKIADIRTRRLGTPAYRLFSALRMRLYWVCSPGNHEDSIVRTAQPRRWPQTYPWLGAEPVSIVPCMSEQPHGMPPCFERPDNGLTPIACATWEGFVFINLDCAPESVA